MNRRVILRGIAIAASCPQFAWAASINGERLAAAARAQVGVTTGYDPAWTSISYPNGDVPRTTGVCADVIIRAARDAFALDLQKLVHEDMTRQFDEYPSRRVWKEQHPDPNIDHRRVLNLETYFKRCGACFWHSSSRVPGDEFPKPLETGDIITWLLDARLPHIGVIVQTPYPRLSDRNVDCRVVHNIGRGAEESVLAEFHPHLAIGHYRWPVKA